MRLTLILVLQLLLFACSSREGGKHLNNKLSDSLTSSSADIDSEPELTAEQAKAFDALNSLQLQSKGHLYLTFMGSIQPCQPPDTTFNISRAELMSALQQIDSTYCNYITIEERTKLTTEAALVQEEYRVEQCYGTSLDTIDTKMKSPVRQGVWILREVLGRKDVILEW